jgi:hypothetical protein
VVRVASPVLLLSKPRAFEEDADRYGSAARRKKCAYSRECVEG